MKKSIAFELLKKHGAAVPSITPVDVLTRAKIYALIEAEEMKDNFTSDDEQFELWSDVIEILEAV